MSDLPYGPFGFPNVRAWGMAPPLAPQDLDPVEAAAMPITPDPPVRKKSRPGVAAFEAVLEDVGGDYERAIQVFATELAQSGIAPDRAMQAARARAEQSQSLSRTPDIFYDSMEQQAGGAQSAGVPAGFDAFSAGMAQAQTGKTRAQRLADADATDARWDRMKENYDRATGLEQPAQQQAPAGPYAEAGRPGYDRTFTPSEVLGNRAEAEAERDARLEPMLAANRRDRQERQAWKEQNPDEAASLAANARARGDDYRRERMLYRMAEQSGKSIEELRQSPQFASVGQIPSRDGGAIPTLERTREGVALGDMPTSLSSARDAAASRRIADKADREKQFRSQMMLAGGNAAKNAVNAFNLMTPEQQQEVLESRLKYPNRDGGKGDEWDRRLDMMRIQMENDRAEREKDRTMTREERQAAREADERRFAEERARRDQEWKERVAQNEREMLLAQQRHEQQMISTNAQLEALRQQGVRGDAELGMMQAKQQAAEELQNRTLSQQDQALREQRAIALAGPGGADIARGNFGTPAAQASFSRLAADADQTWNGFFTEDAARLDAMLVELGITDPAQRKAIVQEYGINSDFPGYRGRGSVLSSWRVRHPDYAPVSPAQ